MEGGATLNGAMLQNRLVNKVQLFIAPKIIGGGADAPVWCQLDGADMMSDALRINNMEMTMVEGDCCLTGYPSYEEDT